MGTHDDYFNRLISKMQWHQHICDKNMSNGVVDDWRNEQALKNIFIGFEHKVRKIHEDPSFDNMEPDILVSQLNNIANDVISSSNYKNKDFALSLLDGAITGLVESDEQNPDIDIEDIDFDL